MAISLRRSRRATKKGLSEYNVGDIVEVRDFGFGSFDTGLDLSYFRSGVKNRSDPISTTDQKVFLCPK